MTAARELAPFDMEGKPATKQGENIALLLIVGVLEGKSARKVLDKLLLDGNITVAQHTHFVAAAPKQVAL